MGSGASAHVEDFARRVNSYKAENDVLLKEVEELNDLATATRRQHVNYELEMLRPEEVVEKADEDPHATKQIFINDLPPKCDEQMLKDYFSNFGKIAAVKTVIRGGRQCGYVVFDDYWAAEEATTAKGIHNLCDNGVVAKKCAPCADAADLKFENEDARKVECRKVAESLASKGFSVSWLLHFWRTYGERPGYGRVLVPAPGNWKGAITRLTSTNDVVRDIIIPQTAKKMCCYIDLEPEAARKPGKLVSHWWGASFYGDVLCIVQDATGLRGEELVWFVDYGYVKEGTHVTEDVLQQGYWMCIFAVNQHVSICGMCNDCKVVSIGTTCDICDSKLYNPCSCGTAKFQTGHTLCQMDKFDIVMSLMDQGLAVALDSQVKALTRVWVVSEIGKSIETGKPISWQMPNQIDDTFCGAVAIPITKVCDCEASLQADRDRILKQIHDTVGIDVFDDRIADEVVPILTDYALAKVIHGDDSANRVRALLKRGANPNAEVNTGRSALFAAAKLGKADMIQVLLEAKATLDCEDRTGVTPMRVASYKGHLSVVTMLLAVKADVDRPDNNSITPVFRAAQMGHSAIVNTLIMAKADLDVVDMEGDTALLCARKKGYTGIVAALRDAGAHP